MKLKIRQHKDKRRALVEYITDFPIRTSKVMFIKEDSILGKHYHKKKDDIFYLLKGRGYYTLDGETLEFKKGDCIFVKAGVKHSFQLKKGSILIESSSLPYDKEDEYEI